MNIRSKHAFAATIAALAPVAATAALYVDVGFPSDVYNATHDSGTGSEGSIRSFTDDSAAFSTNGWNTGSSTANAVYVLNTALDFPSSWADHGFAATGHAAGWCRSGKANDGSAGDSSQYRAATRKLASGHYPTSGTFSFRVLMRQDSGAGVNTTREGMMRGVGLSRVETLTNYGRTEGANMFTNGVWFAFRKTESSSAAVATELDICFGNKRAVLVPDANFREGTTYLCVAEVAIDSDGENETCRAFAVPVESYVFAPKWTAELGAENVITAEKPLSCITLQGLFPTGNCKVAFDEIAVGESVEDVVPVEDMGLSGAVSVNGTVAHYVASVSTNSPENVATITVSVKRGTGASALIHSSVMADGGDGDFACDVSPLSYGMTYYYAFDAVVTMTDGSTVELHSVTNSFDTFVTGPIYVKEGSSGVSPYATEETAAPTIADAFKIAASGATIRVSDGHYEISERIQLHGSTTVEGISGDPAKVVISLPEGTTPGATTRFFNLYDDAKISAVTLSGGHVLNGNGGNVWMRSGTITNCIIENGAVERTNESNDECSGAGIYAQGGRIVDCKIRGNRVLGDNKGHNSFGRSAGLYCANATAQAVVQNCLFEDNGGEGSEWVVYLGSNWTVESCTVVASTLGAVNSGDSTHAAAVRIGSASAKLRNCAVARVVDAAGTPVATYQNPASVSYCAFDVAEEASDPDLGAGCVFAAASSMFQTVGGNPWLPGSALHDRGSLAEASASLPATDLSGVRPRLVGSALDIGCYEYTPKGTVFVLR